MRTIPVLSSTALLFPTRALLSAIVPPNTNLTPDTPQPKSNAEAPTWHSGAQATSPDQTASNYSLIESAAAHSNSINFTVAAPGYPQFSFAVPTNLSADTVITTHGGNMSLAELDANLSKTPAADSVKDIVAEFDMTRALFDELNNRQFPNHQNSSDAGQMATGKRSTGLAVRAQYVGRVAASDLGQGQAPPVSTAAQAAHARRAEEFLDRGAFGLVEYGAGLGAAAWVLMLHSEVMSEPVARAFHVGLLVTSCLVVFNALRVVMHDWVVTSRDGHSASMTALLVFNSFMVRLARRIGWIPATDWTRTILTGRGGIQLVTEQVTAQMDPLEPDPQRWTHAWWPAVWLGMTRSTLYRQRWVLWPDLWDSTGNPREYVRYLVSDQDVAQLRANGIFPLEGIGEGSEPEK